MSGSQAKTETSESQSTKVNELNLQDTGGFTVADNKGTTVNYTTTDDGAVSAATSLAQAALGSNTNLFNSAVNLASDALGANVSALNTSANLASDLISSNTNTTNSAFSLAGTLGGDVSSAAVTLGQTALDSGNQLANAGLDHAAAAYQSGLTFGQDALSTVANIAQDSALHEEALTNQALSGYQAIAQQNSASDSTQIQKVAIYVLVAAVAIVVLPPLFKSS